MTPPADLCGHILGPGSDGATCVLSKGHGGDMHSSNPDDAKPPDWTCPDEVYLFERSGYWARRLIGSQLPTDARFVRADRSCLGCEHGTPDDEGPHWVSCSRLPDHILAIGPDGEDALAIGLPVDFCCSLWQRKETT